MQSFVSRLITLAHATSTQRNIAIHIRSYQTFCELRALQSFPISVESISLYVAYLVMQKRAYGTVLVSATKTIQCQQRSLILPIPMIPGSCLCPISALRCHLALNPGPVSAPLFSVLSGSGLVPITYKQFRVFLSRVVSKLRLDPSLFSPHSFQRGGATFAFDCHIPSEIIKMQGDWQSDAYLVYLELSQQQKQCAAHAMAHKLQSMFSA